MKNKIVKVLVFAVLAAVVFGAVSASAFESYNTYTYSIDGEPIDSPAAYTTSPQEVYNSTDMGLTTKFGGTKIGKSTDIATDEEGRVYLTDPEGDRIVILDKHFKAIGVIILGWGIVQVGMSIQSHDASQRTQGFLCLFGGLMIAFAKEILVAIGAI